jgi:hypothetical protein
MTVCKYLEGVNKGTKSAPKWIDEVRNKWVENTENFDLK